MKKPKPISKNTELVGLPKCDCCGNDICGNAVILTFSCSEYMNSTLYERKLCFDCYDYIRSVVNVAIRIGGKQI